MFRTRALAETTSTVQGLTGRPHRSVRGWIVDDVEISAELKTIKKLSEFGTADRDELGMAIAVRSEQS